MTTTEEMNANKQTAEYAARLEVDYPERLDRLTTFFRIIWIIPIAIILGLISGAGETVTNTIILNEAGEVVTTTRETVGGLASGLSAATALMIIFCQCYPRWWFDWNVALARFCGRVTVYLALLRDEYPSTDEEQAVHIDIKYPDVKEELSPVMPLFKWLLALPHYIVLLFITIAAVVVVIIAWFVILFTGRYPRSLFDFEVGVLRWYVRVYAYAFLMTTDRYPLFSLSN